MGAHKPVRPDWVSAASLQASLQTSGVVPAMHAAAERERRLALSTALARQQLAMGVDPARWREQQRQRLHVIAAAAAARDAEHAASSTTAAQAGAAQPPQVGGQPAPVEECSTGGRVTPPGSAATAAAERSAPGAAKASAAAGCEGLPDAIQSSWLLRSVKQQQQLSSSSRSAADTSVSPCRQAQPPQQQAPPSPQHQPQPARSSDRLSQREALQQLVRQLLPVTGGGVRASQLAAVLAGALTAGNGVSAGLQRHAGSAAAPPPSNTGAPARRGAAAPPAAQQPVRSRPAKGRPSWDDAIYVPPPVPRNRRQASLMGAQPASGSSRRGQAPAARRAGSKPAETARSALVLPPESPARDVQGALTALQAALALLQGGQLAEQPGGSAPAAADIELRVAQQMAADRAAAEQTRLQRLAALEERMCVAVEKVEQRLAIAPSPQRPLPQQQQPTLDSAALHALLSSLDRLEAREGEVRQRWLQDSPQLPPPSCTNSPPPRAAMPLSPQPPAPPVVGISPAPAALLPPSPAHRQGAAPCPVAAQEQPCNEQQGTCEAVSDAMLRSVLRARRHSLKRQQRMDGGPMGSKSGAHSATLQPCRVVEAVADMLIDDMLLQQAQGVWCARVIMCGKGPGRGAGTAEVRLGWSLRLGSLRRWQHAAGGGVVGQRASALCSHTNIPPPTSMSGCRAQRRV